MNNKEKIISERWYFIKIVVIYVLNRIYLYVSYINI